MDYYTVDGEFENVTVIERSKFICYIKGVENEDQAKEFIQTIRKKKSLANHNCYAYIADDKGLVMKFSDDGEPQGTAGLPMLEVLKNKRLYKTVAVVTRYFGGIKLGTGGLTRAYGGAVLSCLENSKISHMQEAVFYNVVTTYDEYTRLVRLISNSFVRVSNTDFADNVTLSIVVKKDYEVTLITSLLDVFKGKKIYEKKGIGFFPFGE